MVSVDVFAAHLSELRSAETRLIDALPRVIPRAASHGLAELLVHDHVSTRRHRSRLDVVIGVVSAETRVPDRDCARMRDLIVELDGVAAARARQDASDGDLVRAVQRVKQFEITSYSSVCTLADGLVLGDAARALARTLAEERETDRRLREIAGRVLLAS